MDMLGEPPLALHPVVWYGKLIRWLERRAPERPTDQLIYGTLMLILAAPAALLPVFFIRYIAIRLHRDCQRRGYSVAGRVLSGLIEGAALKPFFALKMLVDAGKLVRRALERQDLPAAREALQQLVSRDRSQLSTELVVAATI